MHILENVYVHIYIVKYIYKYKENLEIKHFINLISNERKEKIILLNNILLRTLYI